MTSGFPLWVKTLLYIAPVVPIAVYLLIIANVGNGVARWWVRLSRPPLLMLLLTPGIAVGHGIGIAPMFVMLVGMMAEPSSQLAFNLVIWLVYSILGFLAELWVAGHRARRQKFAVDLDELRDRSDALKQLSNSSDK